MKSIRDRLQRLEHKSLKRNENRRAEDMRIQSRLLRGALAGLNADELKHFGEVLEAWGTDFNAKLTPQQQAALDAYERHYHAFLTTGRVQTVFGHPVDYGGEWPQAGGEPVGYYVDSYWWSNGAYCLDLYPKASVVAGSDRK